MLVRSRKVAEELNEVAIIESIESDASSIVFVGSMLFLCGNEHQTNIYCSRKSPSLLYTCFPAVCKKQIASRPFVASFKVGTARHSPVGGAVSLWNQPYHMPYPISLHCSLKLPSHIEVITPGRQVGGSSILSIAGSDIIAAWPRWKAKLLLLGRS